MRRLSSLIVLYAGSLCLLIPEINVKAKESSESGCKTHKNASCSGHHGALKGYTLVPERLDFGSITIGEVALRYIQIHGKNSTIKLIRTVPVDMTMFYLLSTEVPQKGLSSCKLKLALVPKILGIIDTVLVVFTSFGEIPVPVRARISQSPFRIFPIEHPRIPVGANYSTDITLFNPFDEPLSIQRIYLSGGPFHLFLPDVVQLPVNQRFLPKPKGCWQIPPFESRIVASLFMDTLRSFREQAFLRVEFNNSVCDELFLPVDATVWQGDGLYSVDGILQFGVRRVMDNPLYLPLKVRLTDKSSTVHIEDIIDGTRNPGVAIDVMKRTVVDDEITVIANVSFNATMYKGNETVMGNIIIKAASSQLIVPYRAFVVSGELIPFKNSNFWLMPHGLGEATTETLIIKNIFASPVVVLKVLIRQNVAFSEIELVDPGFLVKIPPGQARHVVKFKVIVRSRITHSVKIQLVTNVGLFDISVTLYTGDLRIDLSEIMDILNDGIVVGESFQRGVSLYNTNPVLVVIHNITLASQCFGITRVYVCPAAGNCSKNISVISNTVLLKPSESVRVQLAVKGVVDEGLCPGKWSLNTEYQVTTVPLDTFVLGGRIEIYLPEAPLIIDGIYPSSIAQRNLTVFNTFHKAIEIVNIFSEELPSLRLMPNLDGIVISPRMGLSFDTLTFDARQLCKELSGLCYAGFDLETLSEKTETWKRPFRIINYSSVEIDRRIRERQRSLWTNVSEGHPYFQIDSTLTVTTTGVYKFYLPVSLRFVWPPPMISSTSEKLEFPLLSLGNSSELDVEVKNPADRPLFVHAYVFKDDESQVAWNRDIFYVKSIVPKGTTTGYYRVDDERLPPGLRFPTPPPGTAASIVPDRGTFLVKLAFQPQTETCYNAVLYIRNNLTVIETIHVHGCGVEPKLQISNDSTSALSTHLVIRFTGNDAIYCRNRSPDCSDRNEIRRSGKIVVTNVGGAYVAVEKVVVEEDDWYHRSFSVLNTGPFVIPPKKAKKVFVQFSPDFGMGIKRGTVLVFVKDRVEPVSFQIIGEVEERAVKLCRSVFGRSEKDLWIRYVLFTKKWGWTFYFLPVILFGLYLAFIRKWYTKRLKEEFLRRLV